MLWKPLAVIVAAAGLAGLGSQPAAVASGNGSPVVEVRLVPRPENADQPYAFDPVELVVEAGTTVRWVNDEDVFHTITSTDHFARRVPNGLIRERLSRAGQSVEVRFDTPGTYAYYCQPHADFMLGTVHVVATAEGEGSRAAPKQPPDELKRPLRPR